MKRMTHAAFLELRRGATVLSRDSRGEKVLLRPDGRIVKLFRRKRLFSSALWLPYARRFERASVELALRGIRSVFVEQVARVHAIRRDVVVYPMVPGVQLRQAIAADPRRRDSLLRRWIAMLARMHGAGVYFRAAHFGNVIVGDVGAGLAIIDVSETRFRAGSLSPAMRARNFKAMIRYPEDRSALRGFGVERFVEEYLANTGFTDVQRRTFLDHLARIAPMFRFPDRGMGRASASPAT